MELNIFSIILFQLDRAGLQRKTTSIQFKFMHSVVGKFSSSTVLLCGRPAVLIEFDFPANHSTNCYNIYLI